jgi:hypothetical protein
MSYSLLPIGTVMKIQLAGLVLGALCGACGSGPDGEPTVTSASEDIASTADLAGAYAGGADAQYANLVLDRVLDATGHYPYFLEQKPGLISCTVGTGCTVTHEREEGTYSATATHLTFEPTAAPRRVYAYVHGGDTLTLTRSAETGSYTTITSHCDTAADCPGEGLIRPDCATKTSGWECNANACSYACSR